MERPAPLCCHDARGRGTSVRSGTAGARTRECAGQAGRRGEGGEPAHTTTRETRRAYGACARNQPTTIESRCRGHLVQSVTSAGDDAQLVWRAAPPERGSQLFRLPRRHPLVVAAMEDQERHPDAVGPPHRGTAKRDVVPARRVIRPDPRRHGGGARVGREQRIEVGERADRCRRPDRGAVPDRLQRHHAAAGLAVEVDRARFDLRSRREQSHELWHVTAAQRASTNLTTLRSAPAWRLAR